MAEDHGQGTGFLVGLLIGTAVGAAVALLFAPAAGKETREFLGEKAREARDKATDAARQTGEVIQRQRDTIMSAVERGREAYRDARSKENA
jgi:gas vesicle protein